MATAVLGLFGMMALCLAVIGIYAVTAHAVASEKAGYRYSSRSRSPRMDVIGLMMRRWLTPFAVGIAGGMLGGALMARALSVVIGGFNQPDLLAPTTLPLVLGAAAVVACWLPVWRVLRHVELTTTLREPA